MLMFDRYRRSIARHLHIDHRALFSDIFDIDLRRASLSMALRNIIGIAWPIILLVALGHPHLAIITGVGAFSVAFSDRPGTDLYKFPRMFATTFLACTGVFMGLMLHGSPVPITLYAILLSGFAALLTVFGPGPTQSGATTVVAFLVASQFDMPLADALQMAGLVFVVGLVQSLLAITVEPVRIRDSRGETLVSAYRALTRYVRDPLDQTGEVPAAAQLTHSTQLVATYDASPGARESRHIINSLQRLQSDVITIRLLADDSGTLINARTRIGLQHLAASAIEAVGNRVLHPAKTPGDMPEIIAFTAMIEHTAAHVKSASGASDIDHLIVARFGTIAAELEKSLDWIDRYRVATNVKKDVGVWIKAWMGRLRGNVTLLKGSLTWNSPSLRHAFRQMLVIGISFIIYFGLDVPWGFWIPLTAIVVLRPDYGQTLSRGLGRILGTLVGLAIGSIVMSYLPNSDWWWAVAVIGFAFMVRILNPTGFMTSAMAISAYVVALLHVRGLTPGEAFVDRSINTVIGGGMAMAVFLLWPTWEHIQTRDVLANMVEAYRRVYTVACDSILHPGMHTDPEIHATRSQARLARANAAAFISRIRIEPGTSRSGFYASQTLLMEVQQMALHELGFEGYLRSVDVALAPDSLQQFLHRSREQLDIAAIYLAHAGTNPPIPAGLKEAALQAQQDIEQLTSDHQWIGVSRAIAKLVHDADAILTTAHALGSMPIDTYSEPIDT